MALDNISKLLIGNIPNDLSEVISFNIDRAIKGESSQFIYGLDAYLKACVASKDHYLKRGKDAILKIVEENPKSKIDINMFNELSDTYFIFNGALEEGVLIGFDMEKEGCPRALYTRNFKVIRELANMGCISNADKIAKAEQSVKGAKTLNGLKNIEEALIGVARLDFEGIVNGKKMYKVVVPQQALRVGLNNPILMTPLKAMYILASKLDYLFSSNIVRFTETTGVGVKQGVVSANGGIVRRVYGSNDVSKKLSLIESGYNYNLLRYFTYDLESSVHSKGYATFRPEMLDRLELLNEKDIDKSKHNIDYRLLRSIFDEKVKNLSLDDMYGIRFYDLSAFATVDDKCDALLSYANELDGSELYTLMKQNYNIFGDLSYELAVAEAKVPKVVKDLKIVSNPTVEQFKDMVEKGLVKVTTLTKKGKVMEVTATNNRKILMQMLGRDYIREFESPRYKYKEFKKVVENTRFKDRGQIEELALKYGIDLGVVVNNVDTNFNGDVTNLVKGIDSHLEALTTKTKNRSLSPTMVAVRNVYAKESKDLYVTIDVSQIKQIEYAPIG